MKFASDFRKTAREALKGKWGLAVGTGIVAALLGGSTIGTGTSIDVNIDSSDIETIKTVADNATPLLTAIALTILSVVLVISIAMFILGSIVQLGYANFNTRLVDNANPEFNNLFGYFKHWKNAVLTNLLKSIYIVLWTLLFVIPGIIAAFSYAMTPYILADNPDLSPREALKISKEMMRGNKWRLFCLSFSFIGWQLLCGLTLGIGYLWLNPYIAAAHADFYREISGTRPMIILEPETGYEQI